MQNQEDNLKTDHTGDKAMQKETDITAENDGSTAESAGNEKGPDTDTVIKELNDKYLRLYSEFDNYRKRTNKEKADYIKSAGEDVFKAILPIIDDFERAIKANESVTDAAAIKEGIALIYNKLKSAGQQKGLIAFDSIGEVFNPDVMEAITNIPAADESQKGKVIDEIEKGYKLGDKVIRFAKVVIAQ